MKHMKQVYELVFLLENGDCLNLIYSSYKRAIKDSQNRYCAGKTYELRNEELVKITNSFVAKRTLF